MAADIFHFTKWLSHMPLAAHFAISEPFRNGVIVKN
jgi:hypothetical protein